MDMWGIWLILAGVFLIIEIITHGFLVFWLAVAALVAMVASFIFPDAVFAQVAIFLIASCILIPLTKPLVKKFATPPTTPMNALSLVGRVGIVTTEINTTFGTGQIKVNGETWSARCKEGTTISKGTEVDILKVDGVKLEVVAKS
ncbi:MAG: NfeD family protein [Oscillospiraceae bacterium]|nr:NfeD family protein [Oscillospiraceae bacterium]